MGYKSLRDCLKDLGKKGWILEIKEVLDPELEIPYIHRLGFKKGYVLFFSNPKNCKFPLVSNLFGTKERIHYIFRDGIDNLKRLLKLGFSFKEITKNIFTISKTFWLLKPKFVNSGPILDKECDLSLIPKIKFWPKDGGAFITLPQVYTEDPEKPGIINSNLGMYRIQISGNRYDDKTIGLHYHIHRGIGRHHLKAILRRENLKVNVFIGGPPALILASILPLPDGFPEILFANLLANHRIPLIRSKKFDLPIPAEADFCITGETPYNITLPEGPFGDHLGYYSLVHNFPVIKIKKIFHRKDAIWPFTSVGRPPQEDSVIGEFIHELFEPFIEKTFPGVKEIHAVDASGVHPLLLAIGSEAYTPFDPKRVPKNLITQALHLLGNTQTSLSKYVLIVSSEDDPTLTTKDIPRFFYHVLQRVNYERDLHFITKTTIDTLDYSGEDLNLGSKLIISVCGPPIRELGTGLPSVLLPYGFKNLKLFAPGILVVEGPKHLNKRGEQDENIKALADFLKNFKDKLKNYPLIVVVDDSDFTSKSWDNFLWITFTRSNPATDIYGLEETHKSKHWACKECMIIDARLKSYYPPPLEEDPKVVKKIKELAKKGGPLAKIVEL